MLQDVSVQLVGDVSKVLPNLFIVYGRDESCCRGVVWRRSSDAAAAPPASYARNDQHVLLLTAAPAAESSDGIYGGRLLPEDRRGSEASGQGRRHGSCCYCSRKTPVTRCPSLQQLHHKRLQNLQPAPATPDFCGKAFSWSWCTWGLKGLRFSEKRASFFLSRIWTSGTLKSNRFFQHNSSTLLILQQLIHACSEWLTELFKGFSHYDVRPLSSMAASVW